MREFIHGSVASEYILMQRNVGSFSPKFVRASSLQGFLFCFFFLELY